MVHSLFSFCFFFNDTATTEIYTLSLHDALPISWQTSQPNTQVPIARRSSRGIRSEEHTSELQSRLHLVCRLLLEKNKNNNTLVPYHPLCCCGDYRRLTHTAH